MIEFDNSPDRIFLRFRRETRNKAGMIAWTIFVCATAAFGLSRIFADAAAGIIVAIIIAFAGAVAIATILTAPSRSSIVTSFDMRQRRIHIEASREGTENTVTDCDFSEVKYLRLFRQSGKRRRLRTLSLVLAGGAQIILAEQRRRRGSAHHAPDPTLEHIAEMIRDATGFAADPLQTPMPGIGSTVLVGRG